VLLFFPVFPSACAYVHVCVCLRPLECTSTCAYVYVSMCTMCVCFPYVYLTLMCVCVFMLVSVEIPCFRCFVRVCVSMYMHLFVHLYVRVHVCVWSVWLFCNSKVRTVHVRFVCGSLHLCVYVCI